MDLQTSFDALADVIEQFETRGRSVRTVEATTGDGRTLEATVEVPVTLCSTYSGGLHPDLSASSAEMTSDGGFQVTFSGSPLPSVPSPPAARVETTERGVHLDGDDVVFTVDVHIEPTGESPDDRDAGLASSGVLSAGDDGEEGTTTDVRDVLRESDETAEETDDDPDGMAEELAAVRDDSVPAYEDTTYLRRLFETCETFAEMSEAIEMDVSPETVRRYMIEADIHDPTSYDTAAGAEADDESPRQTDGAGSTAGSEPDAPASSSADTDSTDSEPAEQERGRDESREPDTDLKEPDTDPELDPDEGDEDSPADRDPMRSIPEEQLVTDGIGLPADLTIEEVADAVVASTTVYGVSQQLGLEQSRTRQLLSQLNLLDLVMRRLDRDPERAVSYGEVAARVRESAPKTPEA